MTEKTYLKLKNIYLDNERVEKFLFCVKENDQIHLEIHSIALQKSYKTEFSREQSELHELAQHLDENNPQEKLNELFNEIKSSLILEDCNDDDFVFSINANPSCQVLQCEKKELFCGTTLKVCYLSLPLKEQPYNAITITTLNQLLAANKSLKEQLKQKTEPVEKLDANYNKLSLELTQLQKDKEQSEKLLIKKFIPLLNNLKRKNRELKNRIKCLENQIPGTSKGINLGQLKYAPEFAKDANESSLELVSDTDVSSKTSQEEEPLMKIISKQEKTPEKKKPRPVSPIAEKSPENISKSVTPNKTSGFLHGLSAVIRNSPVKICSPLAKRRKISEDSDCDIFNFNMPKNIDKCEEIPNSQPDDSDSIFSSARKLRKRSSSSKLFKSASINQSTNINAIDECNNIYDKDTEDIGGSFLNKIV